MDFQQRGKPDRAILVFVLLGRLPTRFWSPCSTRSCAGRMANRGG